MQHVLLARVGLSLGLGYNMGYHWAELSVSRKVKQCKIGHSTIISTNVLTLDKLFVHQLKN